VADEFGVDLTVDSANASEAHKILEQGGARDLAEAREMGLTGVEISVLAIMALPALVNAVIRLSQLFKSGVVVDARGSRVRITRSKDLPSGSVLVLGKDGQKSTLHQPSEAAVTNLLKPAKGE
jgi:hypothetical protein